MPGVIVCPSCGNRGEATLESSGAFEVRGQHEGKAIRKCNRCGVGLSLGWFGRPKVIPQSLWLRMEEIWNNEFETSEVQMLTPSKVAKLLAEDLLSDIQDGLPSHLSIKDSDIFLPMASLWLFSYLRASQSESINIDRHTLEEIYDKLASSVVVAYLKKYGDKEDPDKLGHDLTSSVQSISKTWGENLENEPSPHWYVAKEVWLRFQPNADLEGIMLLSGFHSAVTNYFVGVLQKTSFD